MIVGSLSRSLSPAIVLLGLAACKSNNDGIKNAALDTLAQSRHIERELVFRGDRASVEAALNARSIGYRVEVLDQDSRLFHVLHDGKQSYETLAKAIANKVEWVEPNYVVRRSETLDWPTDPGFLKLWGMNNLGQSAPGGSEGEPGADMGLLPAWKLTTGSRDIVVGIIDTGIDYLHPDLKDNIWVNALERNGNAGIDDDGNGYVDDVYGWDFVSEGRTAPSGGQLGDNDPMDDNSHGTHCAGTIGAVANNARGVTGVAWHVSLMALKFLDANGSGGTVDAYRAIKYATKMKVDVLSNSWGGGPSSRLLETAIKEANAAGIVFTAAAGNDGANTDLTPGFPAGYDVPNVISVGASDNTDTRASFSNYGANSVDVFAPGVNILSTVPRAMAVDGEAYDVYSGTSMATPAVTGVVALLLANEPALRKNPAAVRERLIATSQHVPALVGFSVSNGRVNALRALTNTTSGGIAGEKVEEAFDLVSPAQPTAMTDWKHTITREGAKGIQLHFASYMIESPYDSVHLYDKNWRLVATLETEQTVDFWSPMVPGDTVHVRFVNSLVRVLDWTTGEWVGEAFANFNSDGFAIDRISYVK